MTIIVPVHKRRLIIGTIDENRLNLFNSIIDFERYSVIRLYVQPGAKKQDFSGFHGDPIRLKIKVHSPPSNGKANDSVRAHLVESLEISKSECFLLRGDKSRTKDFRVNLEKLDILERLLKLI